MKSNGCCARLAREALTGFLVPIFALQCCLPAKFRRHDPPTRRPQARTRRGVCLGIVAWIAVFLFVTEQLNWYGDLKGYTKGSCGLTNEEITKMERLYRANAEAASVFNMRIFGIDGTLLGAVREGGIIRHDQDMDTGMDARQEFILKTSDPIGLHLQQKFRRMVAEPSASERQRKMDAIPGIRLISYSGYMALKGIADGNMRNYLYEDMHKFFDPINGSMYGSPIRYELVSYRCDRRVQHLVNTKDPRNDHPNCVNSHTAAVSTFIFEGKDLAEAITFPSEDRSTVKDEDLTHSDDGDWNEGGLSLWKLRNMADRTFLGKLLIMIGGRIGNLRSGKVSRSTLLQVPPRGKGPLPLPNRSQYDSPLYPQYPITVMWMNFLRLVASEEGGRILPFVGGDSGIEKLFKVDASCTDMAAFSKVVQTPEQYVKLLMYPFFMAQLLYYHASRKTYTLSKVLDVDGARAAYEARASGQLKWARYPTVQDVLKTRDWVKKEMIGVDFGYPLAVQAFMTEHLRDFMSAKGCKGKCCPPKAYSEKYHTWHDAMVDVALTLVLGSSATGESLLNCSSVQRVISDAGMSELHAESMKPLQLDSVLGGPAVSKDSSERVSVCGGQGLNDNGWINIMSKESEPVRFTGLSPQHPMTASFNTYFAFEQPYFPFDHRLRRPPVPSHAYATKETHADRRLLPVGSKPAPLFIAAPLNGIQFLEHEFGASWKTPIAFKLSCLVQSDTPVD